VMQSKEMKHKTTHNCTRSEEPPSTPSHIRQRPSWQESHQVPRPRQTNRLRPCPW